MASYFPHRAISRKVNELWDFAVAQFDMETCCITATTTTTTTVIVRHVYFKPLPN